MTSDRCWSWAEFRAADLGRAVAWVTPSMIARVRNERSLQTIPAGQTPADDVETLVVIGGGTLIDQGKHAARTRTKPLRLIAVPTIWGSGAEASPVVVLDAGGHKTIHMGEEYLPDVVVDWPESAATVPAQRAKEACGDCWAHALEGFLSPLATPQVRADLAGTMQQMLALPLAADPRWFESSRRASAGQARSSVGLVHGTAHTLEAPLRKSQPEGAWHHAKLCSVYLLPVMSFNATMSDKWTKYLFEYGLDATAIAQVLRSLYDVEAYRQSLPLLRNHWRDVLRDRCTRTNSSLVRRDSVTFFERETFEL